MTQRNMKKITKILAIVAVAMMLFATPASACEWIDNLMPWNWCKQNDGYGYAATTYAPPFNPNEAPAMASCCPTQSCAVARTACYVPQTYYRTVYKTVPVTSCQTINTCDPCTGCPVTTFRPVTTYRRAAQLVPYTTYRMVWQNTPYYTYTGACCSPCSTCCSPCSTGGCYSSTPSTGCSSCAQSTTTTVTYPENKPTAAPQKTYTTERPLETDGQLNPFPKPEEKPNPEGAYQYRNEPFQPMLVPARGSKTAARTPVRHVSYQQPAAPQPIQWKASKR